MFPSFEKETKSMQRIEEKKERQNIYFVLCMRKGEQTHINERSIVRTPFFVCSIVYIVITSGTDSTEWERSDHKRRASFSFIKYFSCRL